MTKTIKKIFCLVVFTSVILLWTERGSFALYILSVYFTARDRALNLHNRKRKCDLWTVLYSVKLKVTLHVFIVKLCHDETWPQGCWFDPRLLSVKHNPKPWPGPGGQTSIRWIAAQSEFEAAGCEHCDLVPSEIIWVNMWTRSRSGQSAFSHNAKSTSRSLRLKNALFVEVTTAASGSVCVESLIRGWRDTRTQFRHCWNASCPQLPGTVTMARCTCFI